MYDASGAETNFLSIKFAEHIPTTINVPSDYPTIQSAVIVARKGDVIIVGSGTYQSSQIIIDKEITITSMKPDEPDFVAVTIIDSSNYPGGAIFFSRGTGPGTVLDGFTVIGGSWSMIDAEEGEQHAQDKPAHPDGYDGYNARGGAINCADSSTQTIRNCIVRDTHIRAGNAGSGATASQDYVAGRGGWGGYAKGGGIYIGKGSATTLEKVTVTGCSATGGNGGNGGAGASSSGWQRPGGYGGLWSDNARPITSWQNWGYEGDYRYYSGYGAGIYCDQRSSVTLRECTITNNKTQGGMSGIGGSVEDTDSPPRVSYEISSYGGGIYCAADSSVRFEGCTIADNIAPKPVVDSYHLDPYLGHGGGVAFEKTASVTFKEYVPEFGDTEPIECVISGNTASIGGGLYWADDPNAEFSASIEISDCNIFGNEAFRGAGLFGRFGSAEIKDCAIYNNFAGTRPQDVDTVPGEGGGIYTDSMAAEIFDCVIFNNYASASGGGICLFGPDANSPAVTNCLIINNTAGRDGAGISVNWYAHPIISNCTISKNISEGSFGQSGGFGGGLYCGYKSSTEVIDSIFWANSAINGGQIAIANAASVAVSFSDVQGSLAGLYIEEGNASVIWGDPDTGIDNNIFQRPKFIYGPLGGYYLSQISAKEPEQSPCVDTGSTWSSLLGMNVKYTTRTDEGFDTGIVDMGYHYPLSKEAQPCGLCDLLKDGSIDLSDLVIFASHWLEQNCSPANYWCGSADITVDKSVDFMDYSFFADCWYAQDHIAPQPDPSEWDIRPYEKSAFEVEMKAEEAFDAWGKDVLYQFDCKYGSCHDSTWQLNDPNYIDGGLPEGQFGYVIRTKDEFGNIGGESEIAYVVTGIDVFPPEPNPVEWALYPEPTGPDYMYITMTAAPSGDLNGPVTYKFECVYASDGSVRHNSNWQEETVWTDTGLNSGTTYTYIVIARDTEGYITERTNMASATAGEAPDTEPPSTCCPAGTDCVSLWGSQPVEYYCSPANVLLGNCTDVGYHHAMSAAPATDASGVKYRFIGYDGAPSTDWQDPDFDPRAHIYDLFVGSSEFVNWRYQVVVSDKATNPNGCESNILGP